MGQHKFWNNFLLKKIFILELKKYGRWPLTHYNWDYATLYYKTYLLFTFFGWPFSNQEILTACSYSMITWSFIWIWWFVSKDIINPVLYKTFLFRLKFLICQNKLKKIDKKGFLFCDWHENEPQQYFSL